MKLKNNKKGFGAIDGIMAILFLSVAVLSYYSYSTFALEKMNQKDIEMRELLAIEEKINEAYLRSWESLDGREDVIEDIKTDTTGTLDMPFRYRNFIEETNDGTEKITLDFAPSRGRGRDTDDFEKVPIGSRRETLSFTLERYVD